jgi:hypothetical protein
MKHFNNSFVQVHIMSLKFLSIGLVCLVVVLCSCDAYKGYRSQLDPKLIDSVLIVPPVTDIGVIDSWNKQAYDPKASALCAQHLLTGVRTVLNKRTTVIPIRLDSFNLKREQFEIGVLVDACARSRQKNLVLIPPFIDTLMALNGVNYAICLSQTGFTRSGGNYAGQMVAGIALSLIVGIGYIPVKATSTIYCVVLDHRNKNVAFYKSIGGQFEPIDIRNTNSELNNLFYGYFRNIPQNDSSPDDYVR